MSDGRTTLGIAFVLYIVFCFMAIFGFRSNFWGRDDDIDLHFGLWKFCLRDSCESVNELDAFSGEWQAGRAIMCVSFAALAASLACYIWWFVAESRDDDVLGQSKAGTGAALASLAAGTLIIIGSTLCVTQFDDEYDTNSGFVIMAVSGGGLFLQSCFMVPCVTRVKVDRPAGLGRRRSRTNRAQTRVVNTGFSSTADDVVVSPLESHGSEDVATISRIQSVSSHLPAYSPAPEVTPAPSAPLPPRYPGLPPMYNETFASSLPSGVQVATLGYPPSYEESIKAANYKPEDSADNFI